jgi:hypothetical protein
MSSTKTVHAAESKTRTPPEGFFESLISTLLPQSSFRATSTHALFETEYELFDQVFFILNPFIIIIAQDDLAMNWAPLIRRS